MTNSDGFNPFRYVETENDLNRMLTVYFNNTKGNGSRSDPFWDEASMTLVRAIASYLVDFTILQEVPSKSRKQDVSAAVIQPFQRLGNSSNSYQRETIRTKVFLKSCLKIMLKIRSRKLYYAKLGGFPKL